MPKCLLRVLFLLTIAVSFQILTTQAANAATRTWDGEGTTNNWSDCTNWSLNTCPTTADVATFDATSTKNATIDASFTTGVTTFNINSGYTGTITQARSFTVSGVTTFAGAAVFLGSTDALTFTGAYTQSAGTFTGGNQTVTHTGAFTLSGVGALYTASTGTTIFSNNFTHTAGTGTFSQASGSVSITGGSTRTFDFATTETFNNVTLNKTTATSLTIASGDTMVVTGTSTLTDGNLTTGTWDARGTTSWASTFDGGTGTLLLGGSAVVAATLNSGNTAVNLSITNANVTVDTAGTGTVAVGALTMSAGILNANAATMTYSGAVALSGGTYNAPTSGAGTTTFSSTFDQTSNGVFVGGVNAVTHTGAFTLSGAGATYTATSGTTTFSAGFTHTAGTGTFAHNNGSVKFSGLASTTNVATSETFNNLELAKNNTVLLTVSSGDTLITTGTLTLTNGGFTTGTVEATSTISLNSGWDGGGGTLLIDGVNTQNLALNGGGAALASTVTLNNANFTFSGTGAGTLTFSAVNLQAGTIDATGYSMTFGSSYNQSGGTFIGGSGTVTHAGFTLSSGTYTATSGTTNISTGWTHSGGTYNHGNGTFSSTGGTFTMTIVDNDLFYNVSFNVSNSNTRTILGGTMIVANTFSFNGNGNGALTGTFELRGDITGSNSVSSGTRTISLTGTADQAWSIPSGFSGTFTINKSAGSVTQSTAITTGVFTFTDGTWNTNDLGFSIVNTLTLNGGTLNFGASTVSLASVAIAGGTFNASTATTTVTGNWTHTAGGTFNHDNGTFTFNSGTTTIDVASTETFYNLNLNPSNGNSKSIANNDSLIIQGALAMSGASGNGGVLQTTKPAAGTFQLYGNLTIGSFMTTVPTTFGFYGSGTQNVTQSTSSGIGSFTVDKTGGSVVLATNSAFASNNNLTITNGTFDLNGFNLAANGSGSKVIINAGGTLKLQGGESISTTGASYPQWDAGSTIYYYGTGAAYTLKNYSGYKNVVLDGTAATTVFTLPATTSIAENLTITNGILSLASYGLTVTGTFSNNDTVRLIGSETISLTQDTNSGTWRYLGDGDAAADTYTLKDFGTTDYYNLEIATTDAADIVQSAGAKAFAGTLTVSSGTYNANGQTTTTTGLATLSGGTYSASTATQTFDAGLTLSGGTYTGSSGTADVNGTLTLTTGTFTAPTSTTISGDFVKGAATFTHNSGTVTFDANANHSITGSPSWNSLTLQDTSDNATDVVLTVEAGSTQTINGTLTLDGLDASDRLNIVSSSTPTAATFDFQGSAGFSGDYLDILDNILSDNSSNISVPLNPANSVNSGNTTNWFNPPGITVSTISGNTTESGGTATFTIVLDAPPTADVSIGISSSDTTEGTVSAASLTFTNANWSTPQTVTVTGVNDALDDGDVPYTIVTAAATSADGNYNTLNASDVSVTNTDNDTSGFTVSAISGDVAETGTTATYTIVLTAQPTADVSVGISSNDTTEGNVSPDSLTFTSLNWSTPQTVTVTGVNDFAVDGTVSFSIVNAAASSADSNYNGVNPADVSVNCTDNDVAGFTVSVASGNTTEAGGTATFTVVLNTQPTNDVTIDLSSNDTTEGTVSPASLTFTNVNWVTPKTVTITGVDDNVDDGDVSFSIVTSAASSADGNYNSLNPSDVTVTNTDNDTAGVTVSAISGNTTENGTTASFTIVLNTQPTGDVVINSASDDSTEGQVTSGAALTFTTVNWATPQTVTVSGQDDLTVDGDIAYNILVTTDTGATADAVYDAINPNDVTATNVDNDSAANITVSTISGNTTEAGGTATFTIVLDAQPTADVSIGISSSDTTEGTVSTASLTFTNLNWATPQTVTVTGVNDALDDGDIAYSIITAAVSSADTNYNGLNANDVSVVNTDNDTFGITVTESSGSTDVTEGGATDSYTVVLNTQPTASVVVSFTGSQVSTSSASFTFTTDNWATPQSLTVTALNDSVAEGAHTGTVSHSVTSVDTNYNNYALSSVTANITDNDTAGFSVSAISGNVSESGSSATYTVMLTSQPTADVTVGVTSNDTTEGTVSPSSLTFTSGNWNTPQTVTVSGANDFIVDGTVAFSIVNAAATSADLNYNGLDPTDVSVSCTDNDSAGFSVSGISGNTTETGTTATYTINLTSQPSADVTVGVTSNDTTEGTVSPDSLTFTSMNWNTPQTVTVTGVDDEVTDGTVAFSIVNAAATSADSNYNGVNPNDVTVSNVDNDSASALLTQSGGTTATTEGGATDSYTIVLSSQPTNDVTVSFTPNAQVTLSTSSFVFTSLDWATPQTLTVTAVNDSVAEGAHTGSITHLVSSADSNYNGFSLDAVTVTITDNDTAGITLTESSASTDVTEGGSTDSYAIVLTSQPTNDVTVSFTPNAQVTLSAENFVFTTLNWATPQTMTVTAANDALAEGVHSGTISHAVTSGDTNYNNYVLSSVTAHITDNDTAGFTVGTISNTVSETGTTATYTVNLTSQPTADVSITISSSDTTEGTVSPGFLTFTSINWSTPQTVTVSGVDDLDADGTVEFTILNASATSADGSYNGLDPADVSVSNTNNDTVSITLTQSGGTTAVTEASTTDSYTLVLATTPTNDVLITLTADAQITLSASTLTFTSLNWSTPQTVTVTAVNDTTAESSPHTGTITHLVSSLDSSYNNFALSNVTVQITDNDTTESNNIGGGGGGGGSNSGAGTGWHTKNHSKDAVKEIQDELGSNIPTHWADGYIKNTLEESFIIQVAVAQQSFLDILSSFFIQPNSTTDRSSALQFLLVQSGVDITTITANIERLAFTDIDPTHDDFGPITFAAQAGLVNGYPDGTFQPDRIINRAETLKLVFSFYKQDIASDIFGEELLAHYELTSNPFTDVDLDAWYAPYVIAAYHYGIVVGYPDGEFKPEREVSNAEFLKIAILGKDATQAVDLASVLE